MVLENFDTALYIAGGFTPCSANDLKNEPQGSYGDIFKIYQTIYHKEKAPDIQQMIL